MDYEIHVPGINTLHFVQYVSYRKKLVGDLIFNASGKLAIKYCSDTFCRLKNPLVEKIIAP